MTIQDLVRDYFNKEAKRFDAIYDHDKPFVQRIIDSLRSVVVQRLQLLLTLAPLPGPWTALDVGCGSGRFTIAFAQAGAARVVGIDVAAAMTDLAAGEAKKDGVIDRCEFITAPFFDYRSDEKFDVVAAIGYFDYLDDPVAHLRKMALHCRGRIFLSLPKRWEIRVPIRKTRFALAGAFVRFYSKTDLRRLLVEAGVPSERVAVIDFGRDWIVVVRVAP